MLAPGPSAVIRALGPIDLRTVGRDSMLRWLVVVPLIWGLLVRWGVPELTRWLLPRYGFDLTPYYPLLVSFLVLMVPTLLGAVVGFLLLDHRDDRTLTALQVTPLTLEGYLVYRTAAPMALSVVMTMVVVPLAGLVPIGVGATFLAAVQAAPAAPLYALFVGAFASNKVQGFALLKGAGVLSWPPVLAYFVSAPWQLAFGLDPLYWPVKLFWMLEAGDPLTWLYYLVGLAYQSALVWLLLQRYRQVIHR